MSEPSWGYLIGATVTALAAGLVVWAPRRPRLLGRVSWWVSVLYGEIPALVLLGLLASTIDTLWLGAGGEAGDGGGGAVPLVGILAFLVAGLAASLLVWLLVQAQWAGSAMRRVVPATGTPRRLGWPAALLLPIPWRPRSVALTRGLAYGPEAHQRLDLYRRSDEASPGGPAPVLIQLHGGGFVSGRRSKESLGLIHDLARAGWVCLSADYRLARTPGQAHPEHLVDVKRVIAWARAQTPALNLDPRRIVLLGTSAGAHLATMAALTANQARYQPGFEDADTSISAFVGFAGYYGPLSGTPDDGSSPFAHADRPCPPGLIVHGSHDTQTSPRDARELADRLRSSSGGRVRAVILPGAQHTFDLLDSVRFRHVRHAVVRFCHSLPDPS